MSFSVMLQQLAGGMLVSVEIFFITLLFSLPLGLLICFGRMSRNKVIRTIVSGYISIMRGTPLMLQLMVVYFGPYFIFGIRISMGYSLIAVFIAFAINYAAYFAEIYRGGIESMPVGQYENEAAPGIRDVLERLKAKGYTLALASSKPEELCVSICRRFGFTPFLSAVTGSPAGADWEKADVIREAMRRLRLTDADKPTVLMVGDRKYDVLGAQECGLACVGVEFFGYAAPGELAEAGAAAVVRTAEELEQFILNH
jgi:phosphoglycolate phosphatase